MPLPPSDFTRTSGDLTAAPCDFPSPASLPEAERLQRICRLTAMALARYWGTARPVAPVPFAPAATPLDSVLLLKDEVDRAIVRSVRTHPSATPRQLQALLQLPRATLTRRLARLRAAGFLLVKGQTRAARYRVREDFSAN